MNFTKKTEGKMEAQGTKLFIVDDNKLLVTNLKFYLENRFGDSIAISTFENGESCLKEISTDTNIIVLDYFMDGKNGLDTLKEIKKNNPKTKVIMLSNNEDIAIAIETFRAGAKDYLLKENDYLKRLTTIIGKLLKRPIHIIVKGFSK
jgi:DNA-binding NtrC family response regulator